MPYSIPFHISGHLQTLLTKNSHVYYSIWNLFLSCFFGFILKQQQMERARCYRSCVGTENNTWNSKKKKRNRIKQEEKSTLLSWQDCPTTTSSCWLGDVLTPFWDGTHQRLTKLRTSSVYGFRRGNVFLSTVRTVAELLAIPSPPHTRRWPSTLRKKFNLLKMHKYWDSFLRKKTDNKNSKLFTNNLSKE